MKSLLLAGILCLSGLLFSQCSKDESGTGASVVFTANAAHNTSNYGVYKGVFVGSTGIIVIGLRNDNDNIVATIRINGTLHQFTTTGLLQANKVTLLEFKNGNSSFIFEVDAEGGTPTISALNIEGHPDARIILFKERSDALVACYEGSFNGSQAGTWNVIVKQDELQGLLMSGSETALISGMVNADKTTTGDVSSGASFEGIFVGTKASGTWVNDAESGTWEGIRTY